MEECKSYPYSPLSNMYSRSIDRGARKHIGYARIDLDGDSAMIRNRMLGLEQPHEGTSGPDAAELKRRGVVGLNGLNFFVADMLTRFGPFVTIYLTANGWHPTDIGFALSVGTMAVRWRIWSGKAKNAKRSVDRVHKVMHAYKGASEPRSPREPQTFWSIGE